MSCEARRGGARARPAPTYLDFVRPYFKGLSDTGQEVFDLLEVTVADAPGPVHQEDHVRRCGGRAAELGPGWVGGEGGTVWARPPSLRDAKRLWAELQPPSISFPEIGGG